MYVLKDVSISWKHHNYAFVDCTSPSRISLSLSLSLCGQNNMFPLFHEMYGSQRDPCGSHVGPIFLLANVHLGVLWGTNFNHSHTKNMTVEAWADRKLKEPTGHSRFFSHYPPTVGIWKKGLETSSCFEVWWRQRTTKYNSFMYHRVFKISNFEYLKLVNWDWSDHLWTDFYFYTRYNFNSALI